MDKEKLDFRLGYQSPYWTDDFCCYIFCDGGSMAFTVLNHERKEDLQRVVSLMNDESGAKPFEFVGVSEDKQYIGVGDNEETAKKAFLMTRGWGHLTGIGGLHLKREDAEQMQNDFVNWVCQKLKGKETNNKNKE